MCDCHPWSAEDKALWLKAKKEPNTEDEWMALHDFIERWRRMKLENYKTSLRAAACRVPPAEKEKP